MRLFALIAARKAVPVVAEDLDFRSKKSWLKQYGKRFGSVLSLFRTQLLSALERQCRRRGVELIGVNPAWSTQIPNRHGASNKPGAREGPVGEVTALPARPDGLRSTIASQAAVGLAKVTCVHTVA